MAGANLMFYKDEYTDYRAFRTDDEMGVLSVLKDFRAGSPKSAQSNVEGGHDDGDNRIWLQRGEGFWIALL